MLKACPCVSVWRRRKWAGSVFHTEISHRASLLNNTSANNKDHLRETLMKEKQIPMALSHSWTPTVTVSYSESISAESESLPGDFLIFSLFLVTAGGESAAQTPGECVLYARREWWHARCYSKYLIPRVQLYREEKNRPERRFNKVPDDRFFKSIFIFSVWKKTETEFFQSESFSVKINNPSFYPRVC